MDCIHVTRFLLLLSGNTETNPGPDFNAVLTELQKLSAGQSQLIDEIKGLKSELVETKVQYPKLTEESLNHVESHCQHRGPAAAG